MSNELVLVTGASGFIGYALANKLIDAGYRVRAMHRRTSLPTRMLDLQERGAELVYGDLCEQVCIDRAVAGCDGVIHVAGRLGDWGPMKEFVRQNVDVTRNLLETSREAGARRFLYISSAVVHGFGNHVDSTEDGPYFPLKHPYQITKLQAEQFVLGENAPGFQTKAVRPCNVYGPGDTTKNGAIKMFDQIHKGFFGYMDKGEQLTCPIYIDDLCEGVLLAFEKEAANGRPIIIGDGEKVSWKNYAEKMFEIANPKKKPVKMPSWTAWIIAMVLTGIYKALFIKKAPLLTSYLIAQGSSNYHFSCQSAKTLLGFEPKTFYAEGLAKTYDWYLAATCKK